MIPQFRTSAERGRRKELLGSSRLLQIIEERSRHLVQITGPLLSAPPMRDNLERAVPYANCFLRSMIWTPIPGISWRDVHPKQLQPAVSDAHAT